MPKLIVLSEEDFLVLKTSLKHAQSVLAGVDHLGDVLKRLKDYCPIRCRICSAQVAIPSELDEAVRIHAGLAHLAKADLQKVATVMALIQQHIDNFAKEKEG